MKPTFYDKATDLGVEFAIYIFYSVVWGIILKIEPNKLFIFSFLMTGTIMSAVRIKRPPLKEINKRLEKRIKAKRVSEV